MSQETEMDNTTLEGRVKHWREDAGWGFIKRDDGQPDIFLHRTQVVGDHPPCVGDRVRFEIGASQRSGKPEAKRVVLIDDEQ
jgi:cold shock protein